MRSVIYVECLASGLLPGSPVHYGTTYSIIYWLVWWNLLIHTGTLSRTSKQRFSIK